MFVSTCPNMREWNFMFDIILSVVTTNMSAWAFLSASVSLKPKPPQEHLKCILEDFNPPQFCLFSELNIKSLLEGPLLASISKFPVVILHLILNQQDLMLASSQIRNLFQPHFHKAYPLGPLNDLNSMKGISDETKNYQDNVSSPYIDFISIDSGLNFILILGTSSYMIWFGLFHHSFSPIFIVSHMLHHKL